MATITSMKNMKIYEIGAMLRRGGIREWDVCHTLRADMGDNFPVLVYETDDILQFRKVPTTRWYPYGAEDMLNLGSSVGRKPWDSA